MSDVLITGLFAVAAAILGGLAGRSDLPERIRGRHLRWSLRGEWDSVWQATEGEEAATKRELLVVTRQSGSRVYGHIVYDPEPQHKWDFEGQFSGRFLQLLYFPTRSVQSAKPFLDYGCYFFEMQGDGSFEGYSVSFVWDKNKTEVTKHWLRRRGLGSGA